MSDKEKKMQNIQKNPILNNPRKEKRIMTWDCVWFGHYPQSDSTEEKEPIKWRVLSVEGNNAFLVADMNLDMQPYHVVREAVTWEKCTLRRWLNGYGNDSNTDKMDDTQGMQYQLPPWSPLIEHGIDYQKENFIDRAFTPAEQEAIIVTDLVNKGNPKIKVPGGANTKDKIFLLSYEDVTNADYGFAPNDGKYDEPRKPKQTAYVDAGGSIHSDASSCADGRFNWWLRTPGEQQDYAAYGNSIGYVCKMGMGVDRCDNAVRPALHLNLEHVDCWSYAGTVSNKDLELITIVKGRTTYAIGEKLNLSDMTITAMYSNEGEKLVKSYKTNVKDIDMSVEGIKTLEVSYTERGITQTAAIDIDVQKLDASFMEVNEKAMALQNPKTDWKGIVTWDCIYFGNYPQSDITGTIKEPIRWRILYIEGNDAFLVADRCLDIQQYNATADGVTWETSTIRSWLNGYEGTQNACQIDYRQDNFMNSAFTPKEQEAILSTIVLNTDNYEHKVPGGNNTKDKVFLLSYDEAANVLFGFDTDADSCSDYATKRCHTAYTAHKKNMIEGSETCNEKSGALWLLRSPGSTSGRAMSISSIGMRFRPGERFGQYITAVCPALHLNLADTELWTYAGTVSSDQNEAPGTLKGEAELMKRIAEKRISKAMLEHEYE